MKFLVRSALIMGLKSKNVGFPAFMGVTLVPGGLPVIYTRWIN